MAKSSYEKALEKQAKEAKKLAEQEARRQRANAIVCGQPFVGGMRIMDASAEEILKILLSTFDGNEERNVRGNFEVIPAAYSSSLTLEFEKLSMYGVISSPFVWIGGMWEATLTPQGITYFEDKKIAQEKENASQQATVNIGSITANGSNIVVGDAVNSVLTVDSSITRIERDIEEKGGEDKAELREILEEIKELVENIEESRHIPKNKGLFSKITAHLDKHGWFYAEIISLLGTAALQLMQG